MWIDHLIQKLPRLRSLSFNNIDELYVTLFHNSVKVVMQCTFADYISIFTLKLSNIRTKR